jgi:hypothetical protein
MNAATKRAVAQMNASLPGFGAMSSPSDAMVGFSTEIGKKAVTAVTL